MISFICCSIRPEEAARVNQNIKESIGDTPFEFISHDNRESSIGLCEVYNRCAERAIGEYLCFIHEDVNIISNGWGTSIINKLKEPSCGVIGFAGSTLKVNTPTGWSVGKRWERSNYIEHSKYSERGMRKEYSNPDNVDFARVITLDGFALFVRRDVWSEVRFDEERFKGFHCYDTDFSIAVSQRYNNYVCYTIEIEHFSEGYFSAAWASQTDILHDKWRESLPIAHCEESISDAEVAKTTKQMEQIMFKMRLKRGLYSSSEILQYILKRPSSLYRWSLIFRQIKYKLRNKKR